MKENELPQEYYLQVEEVFHDFVQQTRKDAIMAGIQINEDIFFSTELKDIIKKISNIIQNTISSNQGVEKIQAWLYRTDISEKIIKDKTKHEGHSYTDTIAELIVKRTLQKVVLRYLHKTRGL